MNECAHLINDYLYVNPKIRSVGFHAISDEDLQLTFDNLNPFEHPDMYAVLDDKIIIIEHFEFDASKRTKKGMKGKEEEALLWKRIQTTPIDGDLSNDGELPTDKGTYEISLEQLRSNFEYTFDIHYNKIPDYIDFIKKLLNIDNDNKKILVGFFIENQFPPIVKDTKQWGDLLYFDTIQFATKILNSKDLDFVLFGCYYDGHPQIFYIDKERYDHAHHLIDLDNPNIQLLSINRNELTIYGAQIIQEYEDID